MRVSCGISPDLAPPGFAEQVRALGVTPIITSLVIRAVYEGPDIKLGDKIIALYKSVGATDITCFRDEEKPKKKRR